MYNKYKISVYRTKKRTGFDLYLNIFNILTRGAHGSMICGDSGVVVGSCLAGEHIYTSKVEQYVVMFHQCKPIIVDTVSIAVKSQGSAKEKLSSRAIRSPEERPYKCSRKRKLQNGLRINS